MTNDSLQMVVSVLATIVLVQSVFILGKIPRQPLSLEPQLPETFVQELEQKSEEDARQFASKVPTQGAQVWLATAQDDVNKIEIWVDAREAIDLAEVTIAYPASELEIVDNLQEEEGVQVEFGEAELYFDNRVDPLSGQITLAGAFTAEFQGRLKLGTLHVQRLSSQPIALTIAYIPNSYDSSRVRSKNTGENILEEPDTFSY